MVARAKKKKAARVAAPARIPVAAAEATALPPIEPPTIPAKKDIIAEITRLEPLVDEYEVKKLTTVTPEELAAVRADQPREMTVEERLAALEMFRQNWPIQVIAARLGRSNGLIKRFLSDYKPTTYLARAVLEAKAEELAYRVAANADVDQSMEVLDRLDVLRKHDKGHQDAGPRFSVVVGVSTNTSGTPQNLIPSQEIIDAEVEKSSK